MQMVISPKGDTTLCLKSPAIYVFNILFGLQSKKY